MSAFRRVAPYFILAVLAAVIFYFCDNIIWRGDDVRYGYMFTEQLHTLYHDYDEYNDKIESIGDIISSQVVHYNWWGGRSVVHSIASLFCAILGQRCFAVCNAFMWIALVLLILSMCGSSYKNIGSLLTVIVLSSISFMMRMSPEFQINYIWVFVLVLIFLKLLLNNKNFRGWKLVLLAAFGLIVGWAHDVINVGVGGAIIILWLRNIRNYSKSQYVLSISFGVGALILLLAPGNFVRASQLEPFSFVHSCMALLYSLRSVYVLIVVTIIAKYKYGKSLKAIYLDNEFYWNAMAICMMFVFALGVPGYRSVYGAELMAIIIIVRLLNNHRFNLFWTVVSSISLLIIWVMQIAGTYKIKEQYLDVLQQYESSPTGDVFTSVVLSEIDGLFVNPFMLLPINAYSDDVAIESFQKSVHSHFTPEKPLINVLPDYLQGKDTVDIGNQIVPYGNGVYLLVQSKLTPGRFYMNRNINLLGIVKRDYEPLELQFDNVVKETDKWRARLVDESDYTILGLSNNVVSMEEVGTNLGH